MAWGGTEDITHPEGESAFSATGTLNGQAITEQGQVTGGNVQFLVSGFLLNGQQTTMFFQGTMTGTNPITISGTFQGGAGDGTTWHGSFQKQGAEGNGGGGGGDGCGNQIGQPFQSTLTTPTTPPITIHVRITRFEKCIKIEFLDGVGGTVLDTLVLPEKGTGEFSGHTTVAYNEKSEGKEAAQGRKYFGDAKHFLAKDCENPSFIQLVRTQLTFSFGVKIPAGPFEKIPFRIDGGTPSKPEYPKHTLTPGITDCPGHYFPGSDAPTGKVTAQFEFLTFVYCDGVLLGFWHWGFTSVYEIEAVPGVGKDAKSGAVTPVPPTFTRPGDPGFDEGKAKLDKLVKGKGK